MDISFEKAKLPQGDADDKYRQRPDKGNKQDINNGPKPVFRNGQPVHNFFSNQTGKAASYGESANNKEQLKTFYLPFIL